MNENEKNLAKHVVKRMLLIMGMKWLIIFYLSRMMVRAANKSS